MSLQLSQTTGSASQILAMLEVGAQIELRRHHPGQFGDIPHETVWYGRVEEVQRVTAVGKEIGGVVHLSQPGYQPTEIDLWTSHRWTVRWLHPGPVPSDEEVIPE